MGDSSNWWAVDEEFRGRRPSPRTENYINLMSFEELDTAFRGGTDAKSRDEFEARDNVMDASSLYDSAARMADVQDTYVLLAEGLRIGSEGLFGEWQGPAASASFSAVQGMHQTVVNQVRSLSDAPVGENTASGQLYNMAVAVDWARYAEGKIRAHYQQAALDADAKTHTVDGGLEVIHISDTPEIKRMYAEDLASVLDHLADQYVYRSEGVEVYGVSPTTGGAGEGGDEGDRPPGPGIDEEGLLKNNVHRTALPGPPTDLPATGALDDPGALGTPGGPGGVDIPELGAGNRSLLNDAGPGSLGGLGVGPASGAGVGTAPASFADLPAGSFDGGGSALPSLLAQQPDGSLLDAFGNPVSGLGKGPNGSVLDALGRPIDGLRYDSDGNLVDEFGNLVTPERLQELLDAHNERYGDVGRPSLGAPGTGSLGFGGAGAPGDLDRSGGSGTSDLLGRANIPGLDTLGGLGPGGVAVPGRLVGPDGTTRPDIPGLGGGGALSSGLGVEPLDLGGAGAGTGLEEGPSLGLTPPIAGGTGGTTSPLLPPSALPVPGGGIRGVGVGTPGTPGSAGYPMVPGGGRSGSGDGKRSSVPLPLTDQDWLTPPARSGSPVDGLEPGDPGALPGGFGGGGSAFGGAGTGSGLESAPPLDLTLPPVSGPDPGVPGPMVQPGGINPGGIRVPIGGAAPGAAGGGGYPLIPGAGAGAGAGDERKKSSVPLPLSDEDWESRSGEGGVAVDGVEPGRAGPLPDGTGTGDRSPGSGGAVGSESQRALAGPLGSSLPPAIGSVTAPMVAPPGADAGVSPLGGGPLGGGRGAGGGAAPGQPGLGYPVGAGGAGRDDGHTERRTVDLPLSDADWQPGHESHCDTDGIPVHGPAPIGAEEPACPEVGSAVFSETGVPLPGLIVGPGGTVLDDEGAVVSGRVVGADGVLRRVVDVSMSSPGTAAAAGSHRPLPSTVPTQRTRLAEAGATGTPTTPPVRHGAPLRTGDGEAPPWRREGVFDPDAFDALGNEPPSTSGRTTSVAVSEDRATASTPTPETPDDGGDPPSGTGSSSDPDGETGNATTSGDAAGTGVALMADRSVWGLTGPGDGSPASGVIE